MPTGTPMISPSMKMAANRRQNPARGPVGPPGVHRVLVGGEGCAGGKGSLNWSPASKDREPVQLEEPQYGERKWWYEHGQRQPHGPDDEQRDRPEDERDARRVGRQSVHRMEVQCR